MYGPQHLEMKRLLGDTEWSALCAVEALGRDGWPVSVREVMAYEEWASTETAHTALRALEGHGLLSTSPRAGRRLGWRITEDGRGVLNA